MSQEQTELPTPERIEEIREVLDAIPPEDRDTEDVAIAELLAALDEAEKDKERMFDVGQSDQAELQDANERLAEAEKMIEAARKVKRERNWHRKAQEVNAEEAALAARAVLEAIDGLDAALARWDERKEK